MTSPMMVEDSAEFLEVVMRRARSEACRIAGDLASLRARRSTSGRPTDVLLVEARREGPDPVEALAVLRADAAGHTPYVVLLTATPGDEVAKRALAEVRAAAVLPRPAPSPRPAVVAASATGIPVPLGVSIRAA